MKVQKKILLLEDDAVDILTIVRAMKSVSFDNQMDIVSDGQNGLDFLKKAKELPGLIILDINMPKMNGLEFLHHLKQNNQWKQIPVVVLTTSREQQDKIEAYNLGISGYLIKPFGFQEFKDMVQSIKSFFCYNELSY